MKRPWSLQFHMLLVLACLLLIMITLGRLLYGFYEDQYRQKLLAVNADTVQQLTKTIGQHYTAAVDTIESFSQNATLRKYLGSSDPYQRLQISPLLDNLLLNYKRINSGLYSVALRRADGQIYSDASTPAMNISVTRDAFAAIDAGAKSALLVVNGKVYMALQRPVYHASIIRKKTGDCMFIFEAASLTNFVQDASYSTSAYYVLNAEGRIVASNRSEAAGEAIPAAYASYATEESSQPVSVIDQHMIAVSQRVKAADWKVLCVTSQQSAFDELRPISRWTTLLLAAMVLMVAAVYLHLTYTMSRSIKRFLRHMDQVAEGGANQPLILDNNAEFYRLSRGFNEMLNRLNLLNEHNLGYQRKIFMQELENKQAQLLALQSQINPHFLYNTLECINSAGAVCGSREVEEMSTALAYIFRYATTGSNIVSLRDEVETTRYYLKIQQIRFPGRFSVRYNISQELLEAKVLKFILQPIVENCISHGIKNADGPRIIEVFAQRAGAELHLEIKDNGSGMTAPKLRELREQLRQPSAEGGIGLANIHQRIQLYYGAKYGIEIESASGRGTQVRLTLPLLADEAPKGMAEEGNACTD